MERALYLLIPDTVLLFKIRNWSASMEKTPYNDTTFRYNVRGKKLGLGLKYKISS